MEVGSEDRETDLFLSQPAWSPDGKRLAFTAGPEGRATELDVARIDGSGRRVVIRMRRGRTALAPTWSSEGRRIAFTQAIPTAGGTPLYDIVVVRVTRGGPAEALTHGGRSADAAWSPDGKQIVYRSTRHGNSEIAVANADGSGERLLTRTGGSSTPAWSPDGRWIVFAHGPLAFLGGDLYLIRPDGTATRRLLHCPEDNPDLPSKLTGYCLSPDWQPRH